MKETVPKQTYLIRRWPALRGSVADCLVSLEGVAMVGRKDSAGLGGLLTCLRAQADVGEKVPERTR